MPKILIPIVFVITIAASIFGGIQEKSILSEKNTVQIGARKNPLEVKGVVYFVTEKQLFYYEMSHDIFILGCIVNIALIVWLRKRQNKEVK